MSRSYVYRKRPQRRPGQHYAEKQAYYRRNNQNPANSREEWTLLDIAIITASDRPSDIVLAPRLGRSIQAIQVMRSKTKKED